MGSAKFGEAALFLSVLAVFNILFVTCIPVILYFTKVEYWSSFDIVPWENLCGFSILLLSELTGGSHTAWGGGGWQKLAAGGTSAIPGLFSLLLNLIISLRNHAEGPFLGGNVDPTSDVLPSQNTVAVIRRCCGTKL